MPTGALQQGKRSAQTLQCYFAVFCWFNSSVKVVHRGLRRAISWGNFSPKSFTSRGERSVQLVPQSLLSLEVVYLYAQRNPQPHEKEFWAWQPADFRQPVFTVHTLPTVVGKFFAPNCSRRHRCFQLAVSATGQGDVKKSQTRGKQGNPTGAPASSGEYWLIETYAEGMSGVRTTSLTWRYFAPSTDSFCFAFATIFLPILTSFWLPPSPHASSRAMSEHGVDPQSVAHAPTPLICTVS